MSFGKSKNVSYTSIISYRELIAKGQDVTESKKVLAFLVDKEPLTSRKISKELNIERTNITRVLSDLQHDSFIEVAFIDKCPTTERRVHYYGVKEEYKSEGQKKEGN